MFVFYFPFCMFKLGGTLNFAEIRCSLCHTLCLLFCHTLCLLFSMFVFTLWSLFFVLFVACLKLDVNSRRYSRCVFMSVFTSFFAYLQDFAGLSEDASAWERERQQRDAIVRGLVGARDEDLVQMNVGFMMQNLESGLVYGLGFRGI